MTAPPPPADVAEIAAALHRACGIVFSDGRGEQLRAGFARAADALGIEPGALLARLRIGEPAALLALVDGSVVCETYFSRHPDQLAALARALRDEEPDRPIRAWSAGCATGEEAYTLAALLAEERRRPCSVLGTDVSERAVQAARRGRYGAWSLRGLPDATRDRWLRADGAHWAVVPEVRELVTFERHNLVTDPPPSAELDVVLCRNVLIYFDRPTADAVVRRLFDAVRPGGLVALAPAENFLAQPLGFEAIEHRGGVLWRRSRPSPRARHAPAGPAHRAELAAPSGEAPRPAPRAAPAPAAPPPDPLHEVLGPARHAAEEGRWADAERQACEAGEAHLLPAAFLLAAAAADARGDLDAAVRWIRRALFLDPAHAVARATLVPLLERAGRHDDAARARRLALEALAGVPEDRLLPGLEPVAAGALRAALAASRRPEVSR